MLVRLGAKGLEYVEEFVKAMDEFLNGLVLGGE